jgi:hypothetical protein
VFKVPKESTLNVLSSREKNDTKRGDKGRAAAVRRSMEGAAIKRSYRTRPKCDRIAQFLDIKRPPPDLSQLLGKNTYLKYVKWPRNGRMATKRLPLFGVMMMLMLLMAPRRGKQGERDTSHPITSN